jgi:hypothetical protein
MKHLLSFLGLGRESGPNPLRYRWTAVYQDGTEFRQNAADVSATDPKRSAFFDVDQANLVRFRLQGPGRSVEVDLRDGTFFVDGLQLVLNDDDIPEGTDALELVFFRRHFHEIGTDDGVEKTHRIIFRIGWKASNGTTRTLTFE